MLETDPTAPISLRLGDLTVNKVTGSGPTIVWLAGYASHMNGPRATWMTEQCQIWSYNLIKFDYRGTGQSKGQSNGVFADMTLSHWLEDTLNVIDQLTDGPVILVGSSMGGWLGLKAGTLRPDKIKGLLLLAPAADFTDRFWQALTIAERQELTRTGQLPVTETRPPLSHKFIEDGSKHSLLNAPINYDGPVEIIHGMRDPIVPNHVPHKITELLTSDRVVLHLIKDGVHDLYRPQDLDVTWQALTRLRERVIAA